MGRAGSPIYKGEPGDYDLSFVRSFQLFCPIKISIFSPIAATLANSPFAVSLSLSPPLSATARLFLPCHPPYGSIDRAQPCDSSSSHPRPSCYTATAFSPSSLSSLFFLSLHCFLSFSFFAPSLLSFSFSFSPLSPPCLHLHHFGSNIQLLVTRAFADRSQKAGNEVAYGFRVHTNGRVFHCPPAAAV